MSSMFDFNDDGHVDLGEHYAGYKIFEDCTKASGTAGPQFVQKGRKLDGFEIIILCLLGYAVLNMVCGLLY